MVKLIVGDTVCLKIDKQKKGRIISIEDEDLVFVDFGLSDNRIIETKLLEASNVNFASNGGSVEYYKLPINSTELMDLIEYKEMNCSISNIFKAAYRYGQKHHSSQKRDLEKIIYFATRELNRISKEN